MGSNISADYDKIIDFRFSKSIMAQNNVSSVSVSLRLSVKQNSTKNQNIPIYTGVMCVYKHPKIL